MVILEEKMSGLGKLIRKKRMRERGLAMALAFTTAFSILPASAMEAPVVSNTAVAGRTAADLYNDGAGMSNVSGNTAEKSEVKNDPKSDNAKTDSSETETEAKTVDELSVSGNDTKDRKDDQSGAEKEIEERDEKGQVSEITFDNEGKNIDADLKNFIREATLDGENITIQGDTWKVVKSGVTYDMSLIFKENTFQFVEDETPMTYTLPEGVKALGGGLIDIVVTSGDTTYVVNDNPFTVSADGKILTLVLNTSDPDLKELNKTHNAQFEIKFKASFNLKDGERNMDFGGDVQKKLIVDNTHNASVKKTSWYNPATSNMQYTVEIKSVGISKNIRIKDTLGSDVYTIIRDRFSDNIKGHLTSVTDNGFEATIDQLSDETLKFTYVVKMDHSKIGADGTVMAGKNTIDITADEDADPDDNHAETPDKLLTVTSILEKTGVVETDKNGAAVLDTQGQATINWTIKVNHERVLPLNGQPITDILSGSQKYCGDGIKVTKTDKDDKVISEQTIPWTALTDKTDTQFTYTPADTQPYLYEIRYQTKADASASIKDFEVGNKIRYREQEKEDTVTVGIPEELKFKVEKSVVSTDQEAGEITWKIAINVPENGLPSCVVRDTYPHFSTADKKFIEGLKNGEASLSVSGLLAGESYTVDLEREERVKITFYRDAAKTKKGLQASEKNRTLNIILTTRINEDWIAYAKENPSEEREEQRHQNDVTVTAGTEELDDYARVYLAEPTLEKSTDGQAKYVLDKDGNTVPYYQYSLLFTQVTQDEFVIKEKLPEGFTFYTQAVGNEDMDEVKPGIFGGSGIHSQSHKSGGSISFEGDDTIKIKVPKNGSSYYTYYRADYYIIPKDLAAVKALNQKAADNGGKITLTNEATYNGVKASADAEYEIKGGYYLWKSLLNYDDLSGYDHIARYEISLNHLGLQLNKGNNLIFTDTFENLSMDYSTIRFTPASALVSYDVSGHTLTAVIKDGVPVTLTYSAKVNGNKEVNFKNTADLMGHSHESDKTKDFTVGNAGSGNASIPGIRLLKHEAGNMNKRLAGVSFALFEATAYDTETNLATAGKPILDKNGKQVVVTTDANGMAEIRGEDERDGWVLEEGKRYYVQEVKPLTGYAEDTTKYTFIISENGVADYDRFIYYDNDILKIKNYKAIKNPLVVTKTMTGKLPKDLDLYEITLSVLDEDGKAIVQKTLGQIKENAALGVTGFTYDKTADKYTWTIPDIPEGDVTVQETVAGVKEGYSLVKTYRLGESGDYQAYPADGIAATVSDRTPTVNLINEYSEDKGNLSITKTVTGDAGKTFEEIREKLSFTIEAAGDSAFAKKTIAGTDAGWKETPAGSGKWVYTLEDIPAGAYTVTETLADIEGFFRTTTVNQVKTTVKGVAVADKKDVATVKVTDRSEAKVQIENSYEPKAALTIRKHITGGGEKGVTWEKDLKNRLSFEITGPNDYARTIKASDRGWTANEAKDEYTFTIGELTAGEYSITEKDGDVPYFTRTTMADTAGWQNDSGSVMVSDENSTITITNSYVRQKGVLKLVKTIGAGSGIANADAIDQEKYRKKIEFTVTDPEGNTRIYNLADAKEPAFEKQGHTYTLTIAPAIAGEYQVKETAYDIEAGESAHNYAVDSVVYKLTQNGKESTVANGMSDGCKAEVNADKTTQVQVTNTYSYPAGKLTLVKKVNGISISGLNELTDQEKQKKGFLFTIFQKTAAGGWEVYRTVDATDPGWTKNSDGEWKFVSEYMPVGTYYVAENTDIDETTAEQFVHTGSDFEVVPETTSTVVYNPAAGEKAENKEELNTAAFTFENEREARNELTVAYTNTYKVRMKPLVLTKTMSGRLPQDLDLDKIILTVYDSDEKEIAHKSLKEIAEQAEKETKGYAYDPVTKKYTWTLTDLPEGDITVKETTGELAKGYVLKRTFRIGEQGNWQEYPAGGIRSEITADTQKVDLINDYEKEIGKIVMKKTVTGSSQKTFADVRSQLVFTVEAAEEEAVFAPKTIAGTDEGWKESADGSGEWSYTIEEVPVGDYIVTETKADVKDTLRTTTVNQVQTTVKGVPAAGKKDAATVTVVDKQTAEVSVENSYEPKPALLIKKHINGGGANGVTWDRNLKERLSFEIIGPNNYKKTIKASDAGWKAGDAQNEYIYLLTDLTAGEYTITEKNADVTYFTRTTTADVNDWNGDSGKIYVRDEKAAITITNTYERQKGVLTLVKTISAGNGIRNVNEIEQEKYLKKIEFEVKDPEGNVKVYNLADAKNPAFVKNGHTYTLTIDPAIAGEYRVKETAYDIEAGSTSHAYAVDSVVYKTVQDGRENTVENGMTEGCSVLVSEAKTTQVQVTNTYSYPAGKITLIKKVEGITLESPAGLADAGEQREGFAFTIYKKDETGKWSEYRKVTAADPEWVKSADGEWSFVSDYMPVGTYYISENKDLADTTAEAYVYEKTEFEVTTGQTSTVVYDKKAEQKAESKEDLSTAAFVFAAGNQADNELTAVYTNTYQIRTKPLVVTKTMTGEIPEDLDLSTVLLKVFDQDGKEIAHQSLKEIADQAGKQVAGYAYDAAQKKYLWTLTDLPKGDIKILETTGELAKNYTLKTTYRLGERGDWAVYPEDGIPDSVDADTQKVELINEYTKEEEKTAGLVIQKNVKGDKNWEQVKAQISFVIKDAQEQTIREIKGTDADFVRAQNDDQTVIYRVDGLLVGEIYTVTEIIDGEFPDADRVTTVEVKGSQATETLTAQLTIAEETEQNEVTFENRYTNKTGELELTKTLAGDVTEEEAKGTLQFEIKDAQGNPVEADKTVYTLKDDFTKNTDGTFTLKKTLPIGRYHVKETVYDVKGYAVGSITYQMKTAQDNEAETLKDAEKNGADVEIGEKATTQLFIKDEYTKEKGALVITKLVKGEVTDAEAKAAIRFRVTNKDTGRVVEYTLNDFTYNPLTQVYTLQLPEMALGGYTVEETGYQIEGFDAVTTSYSVDGGTKTQGTAAQLTLNAGKRVKVAFINEYGKRNGVLKITKKLKGSVSEVAAENALRFKVTDQTTGKSKTYSLDDFEYDADKEMYVLELEKTPGGYQVEESVSDIKGYKTVKVTYQVGNGSAKNGKGTTVKVKAGETAKIAFTDQYEKQAESEKKDTDKEKTTNTQKTTTSSAIRTSDKTADKTSSTRVPKTGDDTPLGRYLAMILIGAAGVMVSLRRRQDPKNKVYHSEQDV